jgi:hypothetical protein
VPSGQAEFAGDHAAHRAGLVEDQFRGRHAGENLHPQRLGLLGHPAADIAHRHDIATMVRQDRRHRPGRHRECAARAQDEEAILGHGHLDRRALVLPVGDQPVQRRRVQHGARQDMRANLRALFQHHHVEIGIELFEPDRRRQARRPRPDDHNVIVHFLARGPGHRIRPLIQSRQTYPAPMGRSMQVRRKSPPCGVRRGNAGYRRRHGTVFAPKPRGLSATRAANRASRGWPRNAAMPTSSRTSSAAARVAWVCLWHRLCNSTVGPPLPPFSPGTR